MWLDRIARYLQHSRSVRGRYLKSDLTGRISFDSWLDILNLAFVNWFCGVQVGPTFNAMGPRALIIAGAICTLIGIF